MSLHFCGPLKEIEIKLNIKWEPLGNCELNNKNGTIPPQQKCLSTPCLPYGLTRMQFCGCFFYLLTTMQIKSETVSSAEKLEKRHLRQSIEQCDPFDIYL